MKLTNFNIINMINILTNFAEKKLPQKISYAITRNLMIVRNDLKNEYDCYFQSLNKLLSEYDKYIIRNENGEIIYNDIGIPIVASDVENDFNEEISELLNIEIKTNVELYHIPENVFDYEDEKNRYDSLSASDIINLQSILCNHEEDGENI